MVRNNLHYLITLEPTMAIKVAKSPAEYKNGVAYVNARLAETFGKGMVVLTRGRGYYYYRGALATHADVPSLYVAWLSTETLQDRQFVMYEANEAVAHVRRYLDANVDVRTALLKGELV